MTNDSPKGPQGACGCRSLAERTDHTVIESLDAVLLPLTDLRLGKKKMGCHIHHRLRGQQHQGWCHILTMSGTWTSSGGWSGRENDWAGTSKTDCWGTVPY